MKITWYLLLCIWIINLSGCVQSQKELVILHTNDTHSRMEPLPETDLYNPGKGGIVNRKAVIDSIRALHPDVLLLDAGDFVQGTPYYNLFGGRAEVDALNLLGYDAVTLGNHEFDNGLDSLRIILQRLNCPVVCCNYDVSHTVLAGLVKPYIILKKGGVKIGIVGVGVNPEGLVGKDRYEGMIILPAIETVNTYAEGLKKDKRCDIVICLSHTGHTNDLKLAEASEYIDIIIGGHSHTFLEAPVRKKNRQGRDVFIYQAGAYGSQIGEIKVNLQKRQNH